MDKRPVKDVLVQVGASCMAYIIRVRYVVGLINVMLVKVPEELIALLLFKMTELFPVMIQVVPDIRLLTGRL